MKNFDEIKKPNKNKEKIHFWSLKDYCENFKKEINNESLYNYIYYSIVEKINPYIYGFLKKSTEIDTSYDYNDITTDCYIHLSSKKDIYEINITDIKNFLSNFYKYINRDKRKCNKVGEENLNNIYYTENTDLKIELKKAIQTLSKEDIKIITLYYFEGYTYEQITELCNIKTKMGVKYRIETILKKLKFILEK